MGSLKFKLKIFLIIFVSILVIGTVSFSVIESISLSDAFYFVVTTISTVGYGDVHPITQSGKILAILIIILGVGTFLGVIANSVEMMLNFREKKQKNEKLNMIIGAFFSEIGTELITYLSGFDQALDKVREELIISDDYSIKSFNLIRKKLKKYHYKIDIDKSKLPDLRKFFIDRKDFLLRLLENPQLLEHESFTELLMAVFHLAEELEHRHRISQLPEEDLEHLTKDIGRVYTLLIHQWLDYMQHLKKNYPYLFSLAIRMNPFNPDASPVIGKS
jgi:voltage-gated potassium channel